MKHSHRCGFGEDGFKVKDGCGHEWEHSDSVLLLPEVEYEQAHMCPKCGLGPWTHKSKMDSTSSTASILGLFALLDELEAPHVKTHR